MCDSKELLVSFVYDELDSGERELFRAHLSACAECREEVAGLRTTQRHLASWAPPEPDLGFRIIRHSAQPAPARRVSALWGLAAAAVLVLAAGAALANIDVRYDANGLVLRTGWQRPGSTAAPGVTAAGVTTVDWKQQAEALERRVRQLEASASTVSTAAEPDASDAAVLKRVNALLDQSETRQQRALAARISQLARDIDARRKVDLAVIDQGLMRLQATNSVELRQSRDLVQRMYRATAFQPK
jgi:anti-sigma factor ChrR (cupin superfamily)